MKSVFNFLLIIISMSLSGCTKANSKKWIVATVTVKSSLDNLPVNCRVELEYTINGLFGTTKEKKMIGETDENGVIVLEEEISRKTSGHKLNIYPLWHSYTFPYQLNPTNIPRRVISLSHKGKNVENVMLPPVYCYTPSFKNVNCFNDQDSMWLNGSEVAHTGCINIENSDPTHVGACSENPLVIYSLRIKRNGIVTNLQKSFTLEFGVLNHFVVEY